MSMKNASIVDLASKRSGQLSPDDLAYHRAVLGDLQAAQAAWNSWLRYLARKHQLGQGDTITADGLLVWTNGEEASDGR